MGSMCKSLGKKKLHLKSNRWVVDVLARLREVSTAIRCGVREEDTGGQTAGEAESNKTWQASHFCASCVMV